MQPRSSVTKYLKLEYLRYPVLIDAVIQSMASGFVGTARSTLSLVSKRRVEDWNNGVVGEVRLVSFQSRWPDFSFLLSQLLVRCNGVGRSPVRGVVGACLPDRLVPLSISLLSFRAIQWSCVRTIMQGRVSLAGDLVSRDGECLASSCST